MSSLSDVLNVCPKCITAQPEIIDADRNINDLLSTLIIECRFTGTEVNHQLPYKELLDHEMTCTEKCNEMFPCDLCEEKI